MPRLLVLDNQGFWNVLPHQEIIIPINGENRLFEILEVHEVYTVKEPRKQVQKIVVIE